MFVTTPRLIGAGRIAELTRRVHAAWTQQSTTAAAPITGERTARCVLREEALAADGRAITELAVEVTDWSVHADTHEHPDTALAGHAYQLELVQGRPRVAGAVSAEARRALELEYAFLGAAEPVDRTAHVIADGSSVRSVGDLVLALLMRHARGAGGYAPSTLASSTATLVEVRADGSGRFELALATPPQLAADDRLQLAGELVLGAHGWPLALALDGSITSRRASRFEVTTATGGLQLELAWRYP